MLPVQISHMKLAMVPLWGRTDSLFTLLDAARASGIDITADVYAYTRFGAFTCVLATYVRSKRWSDGLRQLRGFLRYTTAG